MASYRFCRPDDIPRLVRAVNDCAPVVDQNTDQWSDETFKKYINQLDLWPGYCSLAVNDQHSACVLLSCKRPGKIQLLELRTNPDSLRRGHAAHLVTSLKDKVSIVAPDSYIEAIVPTHRSDLMGLFGALDFFLEGESLFDFECTHFNFSTISTEIVVQAEIDELAENFEFKKCLNWERELKSLISTKKEIKVLAVAGIEGYMAYLAYKMTPDGKIAIVSMGQLDQPVKTIFYAMLVNKLIKDIGESIVIPKITETEVPYTVLKELGFEKTTEYIQFLCPSKIH